MMTSLKLKQETKIVSQEQAKKYIGELCLPKLTGSPYSTHKEVADRVLRSSILIHLTKDEDKVQLLCFCMSKLYSIAFKECMADDIDNPCFQEILTPGQIYLMVVKEETENFLTSVKKMLTRKINEQGSNGITPDNMRLVLNYASSLTPEVQTVLSTGNFPGFKCGLKSDTGFTIPLKRTNIFEVGVQLAAITKFSMKFYSVNMRKFYPESWGFLCPAQTPEGENSGLHNYLAKDCKIVQALSKTIDLHMLYKIGLNSFSPTPFEDSYGTVVFADGLILGWVLDSYVSWFLEKLKTLRSESSDYVPAHTEIIYVPKFHEDSSVSPLLYHGIYILSSPWRLVRRILNSFTQKEELLGCLEQLTSVVSLEEDEGHKYSEIRNSNFLGFTASSIPFGEFNPGARNILSSSKMKQAVSFPFFNNRYRSDTKSTVLLHPQSPLVCTDEYAKHNWNDNPMGTNMCLCILSYSGFDMEDAVILNKASIQRGLVRDHVYKTTVYDLKDLADRFSLSGLDCITESDLEIKCDPNDPHISNYLDKDGMPYVGAIVVQGDPVLSVYSRRREQYLIETYDGIYKSYIESVRLLGGNPSLISNKKLPVEAKKVSITYRSQRIVEIGDKFNNRHSQKGICGYLMPPEDLPFSADGSVPDIIFNPHGIPSRSTIGMILEIISSKSAAAKGTKQIVVPFEFSDKRTPLEKFGPYLEKAGLHYNGTQKFYSGISGEELEADVFCGPVYYFRLTHVVQEKFQCGNVGEVDPVTQQPVNTGRSGAIRFGDMERDSILSHGTMDLTLDRLLHASDRCEAYLCENCLHLIPPVIPDQKIGVESLRRERKKCLLCNNSSTNLVQIPYVLVSLIVEMYAAGIRLSFPM